MIKIDIYRSFEQWKNGNVLEHGVPRTDYYSEQELSLVEMGWNYGYDAGRAEQSAQQEPVAWLVISKYSGGKRLDVEWNIDADAMAFALGRLPLYTTPQPPAQPLTDDAVTNAFLKTETDFEDAAANFQDGVRFAEAYHGITKGNT